MVRSPAANDTSSHTDDAFAATLPVTVEDSMLGRSLGGRYKVVRRIGRGGMGSVYGVLGPDGSRLAIKLVHREALRAVGDEATGPNPREPGSGDERSLRRFLREARVAQNIQSEHVTRTIELGLDEQLGLPFIVMELLDGVDLARLVRRSAPLEPSVVARIGADAARGLDAAHAAGIVHRDVKPSNVFLHILQGCVTVKVCDFGIAKYVTTSAHHTSSELTHTGGVLGSPRYMSPEQATNARGVDGATDVWSLCASLFEALTGRALWEGRSSLGELIVAICTEPIPELADHAPWLDPALAAAVQRGLERDRTRRYASMGELVEALAPHATEGTLMERQIQRVDPEVVKRARSLAKSVGGDELFALDPSFRTQTSRRRDRLEGAVVGAPSVAEPSSGPDSVGPSGRRGRPSATRPRTAALAALVSVGALGLTAALLFRSTPQNGAQPSATVASPASGVGPRLLKIVPADAEVMVNGRLSPVKSGAVELIGAPGDAFEITVEHAGERRETRVYFTRSGIDPALIALEPSPQKAEASPVPSASSQESQAGSKPSHPAKRSPRADAPSPPPNSAEPPRAGFETQPAATPAATPTVLPPKDIWR